MIPFRQFLDVDAMLHSLYKVLFRYLIGDYMRSGHFHTVGGGLENICPVRFGLI